MAKGKPLIAKFDQRSAARNPSAVTASLRQSAADAPTNRCSRQPLRSWLSGKLWLTAHAAAAELRAGRRGSVESIETSNAGFGSPCQSAPAVLVLASLRSAFTAFSSSSSRSSLWRMTPSTSRT